MTGRAPSTVPPRIVEVSRPMRRGRGVLLAAVPPGVLTVLGFLGGRWWIADITAAFRAQLAVVLGALALVAVARGRRGGAAVIGGLALANAAVMAPLLLGSPAPPAAEGEVLRVHLHNVQAGGDRRLASLIAELATSDADLVVLAQTQPDWIAPLEDADLPFAVVHPRMWDAHERTMLLSRIPVSGMVPIELVDDPRSGAIAVDVELDGRPIRVLGMHTQSPRTGPRSAERDRELAAVGEWAAQQQLPVVVAGDLNATPWSHPLQTLLDQTDLVNSMVGHGLQPTWAEGTGPFMVPIDHVLHDPRLTTVDRRTGPSLGSAHRSVIVELRWAAR